MRRTRSQLKAFLKLTHLPLYAPSLLSHALSILALFICLKTSSSTLTTITNKRLNRSSNLTKFRGNSNISPKTRRFCRKCSKVQLMSLRLPLLVCPSLPSLPLLLLEGRVTSALAFQTSLPSWTRTLTWVAMGIPLSPKLISLGLCLANITMGTGLTT